MDKEASFCKVNYFLKGFNSEGAEICERARAAVKLDFYKSTVFKFYPSIATLVTLPLKCFLPWFLSKRIESI